VEKGERFVITRHGKPVAELVPIAARDTAAIARAIAELRAIRRRLARRGVRVEKVLGKGRDWRDVAHEGHRY
jgi:prevent-host-death family protein